MKMIKDDTDFKHAFALARREIADLKASKQMMLAIHYSEIQLHWSTRKTLIQQSCCLMTDIIQNDTYLCENCSQLLKFNDHYCIFTRACLAGLK